MGVGVVVELEEMLLMLMMMMLASFDHYSLMSLWMESRSKWSSMRPASQASHHL